MWLLTFLSIFLGATGQIVVQSGDKCSRYYTCPPEYLRLSRNCYYFSKNKTTWQDAFFACQDLHGKFAIIRNANQDLMLQSFLDKVSIVNEDRWIGGMYDWEQMIWKWGASGKEIKYKGFAKMQPDDKELLKWKCVALDPNLEYKWNARGCLEEKYFICQTRLKKVADRVGQRPSWQTNEIPLPSISDHNKNVTNLKEYKPNGINYLFDSNIADNSAFAFRNFTAMERRKEKRRNKKNRRVRKCETHRTIKNCTEYQSPQLKYGKRRRRNKSKEDGSSVESIHTKVYYSNPKKSPMHPVMITEELSFT